MDLKKSFASRQGAILAGGGIGAMAAGLQFWGNPPNMGLCFVCFARDIAGAIGLHRAAPVQYLRPEIPAVVFGAMIAAVSFREWRPRGGAAPIVRFALGVFAAIGALVFLGCSWRALLRLAALDLNAVVGIGGLLAGIALACVFLRFGYSLGRSHPTPKVAGLIFPTAMALLLGLLLCKAPFVLSSEKGPGAMHAAVWVSVALGLGVGFLAQRTRFCTTGAVRDAILIGDFHRLGAVAALVLVVFAVNLCTGAVKPGWIAPISHSNHLWNFLGMVLAGLCFVLGGGCPGRQFFLSGEGDGDAAVFCCGMFAGVAVAHNWALAGVPDKIVDGTLTVGGPGAYGQIAVVAGVLFCIILGLTARDRKTPRTPSESRP
ncbi:MAG: YedE-related selenium metabolism membrane protein [Candidatus Nealsonbacteria bacterium]|nr:YedE-related selenium metabolism membrane protein [Candidatus Nealsonbacteria bacterium]